MRASTGPAIYPNEEEPTRPSRRHSGDISLASQNSEEDPLGLRNGGWRAANSGKPSDPTLEALFNGEPSGFVDGFFQTDQSVLNEDAFDPTYYSQGTGYTSDTDYSLSEIFGSSRDFYSDTQAALPPYSDYIQGRWNLKLNELQTKRGEAEVKVLAAERRLSSETYSDRNHTAWKSAYADFQLARQALEAHSGESKPIFRFSPPPDRPMTDFEAGRTWLDNWVIDPVAGWGTGHANAVTFGATNWLQGAIYGQDILAYNQSGWSYTIGTATGITTSVLMGYGAGAGASSGTFAMHNAVRSGLQAWTITGDVVGMAQSSYNVIGGQADWSDGLGFLPTVGWAAGASRIATARYAGPRGWSPLVHTCSDRRATAAVYEAITASGLNGSNLVDKVLVTQAGSSFKVLKDGTRLLYLNEDVVNGTSRSFLLREAAHEIVHAQQFAKNLSSVEGDLAEARKLFNVPQSSFRYAIDEAVAETLARQRISQYLGGGMSQSTLEWSNQYTREWRSRARARR